MFARSIALGYCEDVFNLEAPESLFFNIEVGYCLIIAFAIAIYE